MAETPRSGEQTPKRLMELRNRSGRSSPKPKGGNGELPAKVARLHSDPTKVHLHDVSYPPSREELQRLEDVPLHQLPQMYKRDDHYRVFCNRSVDMSSIHYVGFDMDYTLAVYKEPAIYELTYGLLLNHLLEAGYPEGIAAFKFEASFPIRGLVLDNLYGNLIKLDAFGHVISVYHGRKCLSSDEIEERYPASFVSTSDLSTARFMVMNTLFNIPEICAFADVVHFFSQHDGFKELEDGTGLQSAHTLLTFRSMFHDVRGAMEHIHARGVLQEKIMEDLDKYVQKEPKLPILLKRLADSGKGLFLLTNSGYNYTKVIMSYLFDVELPQGWERRDWKSYFDLIIVSARKPLFFLEGTVLREVDQDTGKLKLGQYSGGSHRGRVFSGGSADVITEMLGKRGDNILYVGDHIFGDVLKSKKLRGWKTFLIMPELQKEIQSLHAGLKHYQRLKNLEFMLAELYRGLASDATEEPDASELKKAISETAAKLDKDFNEFFGSTFRSGSRQSFFAMQTARYADLYASSLLNLINYPLFYNFHSVALSLPHESALWHR